MTPRFTDIHCHLIPGIDDGANSLSDALAMARIAVQEGIRTVIATPHQLGKHRANDARRVRQCVDELSSELRDQKVPLQVLPGGDVRIEDRIPDRIRDGEVLTLGDHGRHVLLELPHELYFRLESLLAELEQAGYIGILSHPERNQGLIARRETIGELVDAGCLMQVTAGSIVGTFGPTCQELAHWMLRHGYVHFVATDAHGPKRRRPLMLNAFEAVTSVVSRPAALELFSLNPALVAGGQDVPAGRRPGAKRSYIRRWFPWSSGAG